LPQPVGPTIAVMGESKANSVFSAKLLNPFRITFLSLIFSLCKRLKTAASPAQPVTADRYCYRPMVSYFLTLVLIFGKGPARKSALTAPLSHICFKRAVISEYETPRPL